MGSVNVSQSVNGRGVSATISWDSNLTVTVKITGNAGYGAQSGWRIRGQNPDTTIYCSGDQYDTEGSFNATEGKTYYFQAVWGTTNGVSNGASFTVKSDGSSGGDSGGSSGGGTGGDASTPIYLWIRDTDGVKVVVDRVFTDEISERYGSYTGILTRDELVENEYGVWEGYRIWYNDVFRFTVTALEGYEITDGDVGGLSYYEDYDGYEDVFVYDKRGTDELWAFFIAELSGLVYIDNGTTLEAYQIYIDNGSSWEQHIPYIDNGSGWDMCG